MTYIPNPERKIKNGKAVVSAEELAAFKAEHGDDKTLRDLLNMDKGLQRKLNIPKSMRRLPTDERDLNIRDKALNIMDVYKIPEKGLHDSLLKSGGFVRPSPKVSSTSSRGDGNEMPSKYSSVRSEDFEKNVDQEKIDAVKQGGRGLWQVAKNAGLATVGGGAGAMVDRLTGDTSFNEAMRGAKMAKGAVRRFKAASEKVDAADRELNDQLRRESRGIEYKKGGSVSSASSRGDGIASRGKTRGKMC